MTKETHSTHWPLIALCLAAIGVPMTAFHMFPQTVITRPWLSVAAALIYEALLAMIGVVAKIWQNLEGQWVARLAGILDSFIRATLGRYKARYFEYIIFRHRAVDVKGLTTQATYSMDLERVFVELSVEARAPHTISTDLLKDILPESAFPSTVWDFLSMHRSESNHIVLIGPPGCGKTTILKNIALKLASKRSPQIRAFPVLLFLREHVKSIMSSSDFELADAFLSSIRNAGFQPSLEWCKRTLASGRCIVMVDGLDEVADQNARRSVADWVETQTIQYGKNRFLITSRPHGYRTNPIPGVTVVGVRPMSTKQIVHFIGGWYLANEIMSFQKDDSGVRMSAHEGAEDLISRLKRSPALWQLAANPLLLTMIATVHRYRSSLPGRRVELYGEICEVFLGKRQEAKGLELDLVPAQKLEVLQPLAYWMMLNQRRDISLEDALKVIETPLSMVGRSNGERFLESIENDSGLLLQREAGLYSFVHLTFQEYLAACHIKAHQNENVLNINVGDSWWYETSRLYSALADATGLIIACLEAEPVSVSRLALALECADEARVVHPQVRERLRQMITRALVDPDAERRRVAAEAHLALRLRRMIALDEQRRFDMDFLTNAEYQIFIDESRANGVYCQPDHWQSGQSRIEDGRKPVLGVRASDALAFCRWLNERFPGDGRFRLPKETEIIGIDRLEDSADQFGCWASVGNGSIYAKCVGNKAAQMTYLVLRDWFDRDESILLSVDRAEKIEDINRQAFLHSIKVLLQEGRVESFVKFSGSLEAGLSRKPLNDEMFHSLLASINSHLTQLDLTHLELSLGREAYLRWYLRANAYVQFVKSLSAKSPQPLRFIERLDTRVRVLEDENRIRRDSCAVSYIYLVLLEERIRGNIPVFEGIRLMKDVREAEELLLS